MTKLTKQERLYDVTQLAKSLFIEKAKDIDFTVYDQEYIDTVILSAFDIAETFINGQEQHAAKVNHE